MRKRLVTLKYLKGVDKYNLTLGIGQEDYYLSVKEIINIDKPFILSNGLCVIANGYYIVEILPKQENYSMRVFLNEKKEILEYYFDISKENGIDEETKVPFYDDLYLDVTYTNGEIELIDEDELDNAFSEKTIEEKDYNLAKETANKLISELQNKSNKYMNMNIVELIK